MFFDTLKIVAGQVLMLYLISLIGFITDKVGLFRQADAKRVIDLLFHIVLPLTVVYTFVTMEYTRQHVRGIFLAFACAFATHFVGILAGLLCFRRRSPMERGVYRYGILFSNASFLALPLAQAVIGKEGVFYCSVYVAVFNVMAFTYGIYEISGHRAKIDFRRLVLNPGSIAVLIGLPLFFLQPQLPQVILRPMEMVGNCNSPLAMIIFGTFLANADWKRMFAKKELYLCSALRLVVIPLCMVGLFALCGVRGDLLIAMVISSCAPTATNTAMYAAKYENDAALGSELAAQSSLFSIVTMPVIVALAAVI